LNNKQLKYPETHIVNQVDVIHGMQVSDPYRWLEEIDSNETKKWITSQNELTIKYLNGIPAREKLKKRMAELWNYEKFGVPTKKGGIYLLTYNTGLWNQSKLFYMNNLQSDSNV